MNKLTLILLLLILKFPLITSVPILIPVIIELLGGGSGKSRPGARCLKHPLFSQGDLSFGHLQGDSSRDSAARRRPIDLLVGEDGAVDRGRRVWAPDVVVASQNGAVEEAGVREAIVA